MNLCYADEIRSAVLIIPDAVRTDLYNGSGKDAIPSDKLENFFQTYLK